MSDIKASNELAKEGVALTPHMRHIIAWAIWSGTGFLGVSYVALLIHLTWRSSGWIEQILQQHFAATVGLPLAAVGAFLIVNALQITAGNIEVEALGFKLRGASGPILLWVVVFMAISFAIRLVW